MIGIMKVKNNVKKLYTTWCAMKARCNDKEHKNYWRYGGKGIKVCDRWSNFLSFMEDMGKKFFEHVEKFGDDNTQLDRKNSSIGYNKINCRWVTLNEQHQNKSSNYFITYKGQKKCISEWARIINMDKRTLLTRIHLNWSIKKMIETPVRYKAKQK